MVVFFTLVQTMSKCKLVRKQCQFTVEIWNRRRGELECERDELKIDGDCLLLCFCIRIHLSLLCCAFAHIKVLNFSISLRNKFCYFRQHRKHALIWISNTNGVRSLRIYKREREREPYIRFLWQYTGNNSSDNSKD